MFCRIVFFGYSSTPQSVSELLFLISYQRCKMLQNFFFSYQRRKILENYCFWFFISAAKCCRITVFGFLSTMLCSAELFFLTPQSVESFSFWFPIKAASVSELVFSVSHQRRKVLRITFLWFPINAAKCCRVAFLISHQRSKVVQIYFFLISYQRRKMLENYFLVSYQRCKFLQNYFFSVLINSAKCCRITCFCFLTNAAKCCRIAFFWFLINPAKRFINKFLLFHQRCYVLKNHFFGLLSTPQSG